VAVQRHGENDLFETNDKNGEKINIEQFVIKLNTCVDLAALRQ